jgi:hypothetical protein
VIELEVRRLNCRACAKVKREQLDFLADNALYTKRFAHSVGRRCRGAPIKDVAAEMKLDWRTVEALDQQYMEAQLKRAGTPGPKAIGIDEIAIRKGHSYRIVVSDLVRRRPIWFGGEDRSEGSMGEVYAWLGPKKSSRILAGGNGHVETVSTSDGGACARKPRSYSTSSSHPPSRRGLGRGSQERVPAALQSARDGSGRTPLC